MNESIDLNQRKADREKRRKELQERGGQLGEDLRKALEALKAAKGETPAAPATEDEDVRSPLRRRLGEIPEERLETEQEKRGFEPIPTLEEIKERRRERYDEAVKIVKEMGHASPSLFNRRLGVSYKQATEIRERLEAEGIVGADGKLIQEAPAEESEQKKPGWFGELWNRGKGWFTKEEQEEIKEIERETGQPVSMNPEKLLDVLTRPDGETTAEVEDAEALLELARDRYIAEYQKFDTARKNNLKFSQKAKEFVFGGKLKTEDLPQEVKDAEAAYDKAAVELGQAMFEAHNKALRDSGKTGAELEEELTRYKQNKIFTRIVIQEQSILNGLKVQNLPPKEKGIIRRGLDAWMNIKPPWKRLAISVVLSTTVIYFVAPAGVGYAGMLGARGARAFVGSWAGQGAAKATDWLFQKLIGIGKEEAEKNLAMLYIDPSGQNIFDETGIRKARESQAKILERVKKAKRAALVTKALVAVGAGMSASSAMAYTIGGAEIGAISKPTVSGTPENIPLKPSGAPEETGQSGKAPAVTGGSPTQKPTAETGATAKPSATPTATPTPTPSPSPTPTPTPSPSPTPEAPKGGTGTAPTAPSAPTPVASGVNPDAIVHQGKGIEHVLFNQLKGNPALAKELSEHIKFKGDLSNDAVLKNLAHRAALETGYVDKTTGAEVRVGKADSIAYELRMDKGKIVVDEKLVKMVDGKFVADGNPIESHVQGEDSAKFEKEADAYEYNQARVPKPPVEHTPGRARVPVSATEGTSQGNTPSHMPETGERLRPATLPAEYNTEQSAPIEQPPVDNVAAGQHAVETLRAKINASYGIRENDHRGLGSIPQQEPLARAKLPAEYQEIKTPLDAELVERIPDPEFLKNPLGLSKDQLIEVYEVRTHNAAALVGRGEIPGQDRWTLVQGQPAKNFIDAPFNTHDKISPYIEHLSREAGIKPLKHTGVLGTGPAETVHEFERRSLQKITAEQGEKALTRMKLIKISR